MEENGWHFQDLKTQLYEEIMEEFELVLCGWRKWFYYRLGFLGIVWCLFWIGLFLYQLSNN